MSLTPRQAGTPSEIMEENRRALRGKPVRVPCAGCTACCRAGLPINLSPEEAARLPNVRGPFGPMLRKRGRVCEMFDEARELCSIYATRPVACREFDCRLQWLLGTRVTDNGSGAEINPVLAAWRTHARTDLDRGIIAVAWIEGRRYLRQLGDIGLSAIFAAQVVLRTKPRTLERLGREYAAQAREVERVLNGEAALP